MNLAEQKDVLMDGRSRVVPELAVLTLDENGTICDCSLTDELLFGHCRDELVLQHVSKLFPQLSEIVLVKNGGINPRLSFLCHCGHHFQSRGREGGVFMSKLSFVHLGCNMGHHIVRLIVRDAGPALTDSRERNPALIADQERSSHVARNR